jgi:hypothetical protein
MISGNPSDSEVIQKPAVPLNSQDIYKNDISEPSSQQLMQPSSQPSIQPSIQPSSQHTMQASSQPSMQLSNISEDNENSFSNDISPRTFGEYEILF